MAEGGVDARFVPVSEPLFEYFCEFCHEDGLHKEAGGYCKECDEYICGSCVVHHKRNRLSQHHEVLDTVNMPKDTPPVPGRQRKGTSYDTPTRIEPVNTASLIQEIDVGLIGDGLSTIHGSAVLSSGRLVVVDSTNRKAKLIDTYYMNIISELQLPGSPHDIAVMKEDQVAVTISDNCRILILKVTDTITIEREIKVKRTCAGIAFSNNEFIVTFAYPPYIEIMDLNGNVKSQISNHISHSGGYFTPHTTVRVSKDGDTIYVPYFENHCVASLSRDGVVKNSYSDGNLLCPTKMCLDHRGNVFVYGNATLNVQMLTPYLTHLEEIVTSSDLDMDIVFSISHCRYTDRLYLGLLDNDKIQVYQLSSRKPELKKKCSLKDLFASLFLK